MQTSTAAPEPKPTPLPKLVIEVVKYGNPQKLWDTRMDELDGFTPHEMWDSGILLTRAAARQRVLRVLTLVSRRLN